jgi:hypothetical protein
MSAPRRTYQNLTPAEQSELHKINEAMRMKSEAANALYDEYMTLCQKRFGAEEGSEESQLIDASIGDILRRKQRIEMDKQEDQRLSNALMGRGNGARGGRRRSTRRRRV